MSTLIETNTEELQEVLQQVYNLPNRSAGGGYDFTIYIDTFDNSSIGGLKKEEVSFDTTELKNTVKKLENSQPVTARMTGAHCVGSAGAYGTFLPIEISLSGNYAYCTFLANFNLQPGLILYYISLEFCVQGIEYNDPTLDSVTIKTINLVDL